MGVLLTSLSRGRAAARIFACMAVATTAGLLVTSSALAATASALPAPMSAVTAAEFDASVPAPTPGAPLTTDGPADPSSLLAAATGPNLCTDVLTGAPCDDETTTDTAGLTAVSDPTSDAAATPGRISCGQGFIETVAALPFPTFGYAVVYGGSLSCSSPIGLGIQARLETPNHSPEATAPFKDCGPCKTLRSSGGYFETARDSHRIFVSYGYVAPPNYRWVPRNTPGQGGSCSGYGTNFLLCARYSRVFR